MVGWVATASRTFVRVSSSWSVPVFAAAIFLVMLPAGPASAFELFGIKFFESDSDEDAEDVIGEPQRFSVEFSVAADDDDIEDALKGASTLWQDREKPASGAA